MSEEQALTLNVEDMHLRVGMHLFLRHQDASQEQTRYQVEYVGAIQGKSLLVTLPLIHGKEAWMPVGREFVFHAVEGMYVYAFTSRVLRARTNPFPYVHFAWPAQVSARQVRKAYRVRMNQTVNYATESGEERSALLLDLSMTGCQLEAGADALNKDDRLKLLLPLGLEGADRKLSLAAAVRSRADQDAGRPTRYGLEFAELPQEDNMLLHYFIDHAIAQNVG